MRHLFLILTAFIFAQPVAWSYVEGQFKPSEYRVSCEGDNRQGNTSCLDNVLEKQLAQARKIAAAGTPAGILTGLPQASQDTHNVQVAQKTPTLTAYPDSSYGSGNYSNPIGAFAPTLQGIQGVRDLFPQKTPGIEKKRVCGYKIVQKNNESIREKVCENRQFFVSTVNDREVYYLSEEDKLNKVNGYELIEKEFTDSKGNVSKENEAVAHGEHTLSSQAMTAGLSSNLSEKFSDIKLTLNDKHNLRVIFNYGKPVALNDYVNGNLSRHYFLDTQLVNGITKITDIEAIYVNGYGKEFVNQKFINTIGLYLTGGDELKKKLLDHYEKIGLDEESRNHLRGIADSYKRGAHNTAVFIDNRGDAYVTDLKGYTTPDSKSKIDNFAGYVAIETMEEKAKPTHRQVGWTSIIKIQNPQDTQNPIVVQGYTLRDPKVATGYSMYAKTNETGPRTRLDAQPAGMFYDKTNDVQLQSFSINVPSGQAFYANRGEIKYETVTYPLGGTFLRQTEKGQSPRLMLPDGKGMHETFKDPTLPGTWSFAGKSSMGMHYVDNQNRSLLITPENKPILGNARGYTVKNPKPQTMNDSTYKSEITMDMINGKPIYRNGNESFIQTDQNEFYTFKNPAEESLFLLTGQVMETTTKPQSKGLKTNGKKPSKKPAKK